MPENAHTWKDSALHFLLDLYPIKQVTDYTVVYKETVELLHRYTSAAYTTLVRLEDEVTAKVLHSSSTEVLSVFTNSMLTEILNGHLNSDRPYDSSLLLDIAGNKYQLVGITVNDKQFNGAYLLLLEPGRWDDEEFRQFLSYAQTGLKGAASLIQTYAHLEQLTTRFNAILETIPESIVYVDERGKNGWVNHAAAQLLKLQPGFNAPMAIAIAMQELRKKTYNKDEIDREAASLFAAPNKRIFGWKWIFDSPASLVLSVSCVPASSMNMKGRLWVFADVTLLHQQNETLNQLNLELDEKRQLADHQNKAKSDFLANVSHEIRTPMNGVIGMTSLLQSTSLNDEQTEYVESIRSSGENLLTLINDLLDLSKIEAGMMEIHPGPCSIRNIIKDITSLMQARVKEKGLFLQVNVASSVPPYVHADGHRIRQILLNLVGNAIKFTKAGGVEVEVNAAGNTDDLLVDFSVKDTGIGIPPDQYHKLFKNYSQLNTSSSRDFGGTGLGLAICHQLVNMMDGVIAATPNPDGGSIFSFNIKTRTSIVEPVPATISSKRPERSRLPVRILVAEDHDINQRLIRKSLDKLGYQYHIVNNGEEAVTEVGKHRYHIVLMDVMMPIMDGYTASRLIRSAADKPTDPLIIAITAGNVASESERSRLEEAGMNDFLTKPFRLNDLAAKLEEWSEILNENLTMKQYFDEAAVEELIDAIGSPEELVELYELQTSKDIKTLGEYLADHNLEEARFIAHRITGSLGFVGATALTVISSRIESMAKDNGSVDEMNPLYIELANDYPQFIAALRQHLGLRA